METDHSQSNKERRLTMVLAARFCDKFADHLIAFAIPLMVYKATGSLSGAGLAFFVERLPRILYSPLSGPLADQIGARKTMLTADSLRCLLCLFLAVFAAELAHTYIWIPVLASLISLLNMQAFVSVDGLMSQLGGKKKLLERYSYLQLTDQIPLLLAPLLTVSLSSLIGASVFLYFAAGFFLLSTILLSLVGSMGRTISKQTSMIAVWDSLLNGFRSVFSEPRMYSLLWVSFLANLLIGMLTATAAGIVTDLQGLAEKDFAYLNLAGGVFSLTLIIYFTFGPKNTQAPWYRSLSLVCMFSGSLTIALTESYMLFAMAYVALISSVAFLNIYVRAQRAEILGQRTTTALGAIMFLNQSALPVSGLVIWKGTQSFDVGQLFFVGALLVLLTAASFSGVLSAKTPKEITFKK